MGNAVIAENIGGGLYKIRLSYDTQPLEVEIERLTLESENYFRLLNRALDNLTALRGDECAARETMNALIKLWKEGVLEKTKPVPPVTPEDADLDGKNPITGLPYTDEERKTALRDEVVSKVNAERVAAGLSPLSASTAMNDSANAWNSQRGHPGSGDSFTPGTADGYLEMLQRMQSIQEDGQNAHDRILASIPGAVIVKSSEANAAGLFSADAVISAWKADPNTWVGIMDPDATRLGVAYDYQPQHPAANLWSVVTAKLAETPSGNSAFFASAAGQELLDHVTSDLGADAADHLRQGTDDTGGGTWAEAWTANHYYGAGATVKGKIASGSDMLVKSMNSGLSGAKQPLWPGPGGYVGDNGITWVVLSTIPARVTIAVDSYYGW